MERILLPSNLMRMRYISSMLIFLFFTGFCTKALAQKVTIATDKDDYWPDECVIITGTGWQNYDSVRLTLTHLDPLPDPYHSHAPWFINPDADGKIYYEWLVLDQELGTSFELGALGFALGNPASDYAVTYFMDASITNVTVNGSSFCDGQPIIVSYTISNSGGKFGNKNIFTAQLSDASGSFSSPIIIGTLNSKQSGNIHAIIPSGTANGTHYRIRVTSSSPFITSNPDATDLTINVPPTAPSVGTITQPTCSLSIGSVVLNGLPATGTWTLTRTPGGTTTTGTGTSTTITGLAAGTYTYTVTNASGCISAASANVLINALPAEPTEIITNPAAVCSPLKVDLTAAAVTAGSTPGLTFTYWTNAAATIAYATPSSAAAGTYYIKGTTSSGCFDIKPVIVTINQSPTANAGIGGINCGLEFNLGAIPSLGTGTWTKVSGPGNTTFSPSRNTPNAKVAVDSYGTYILSWTEVYGNCSNSATISITFIQQLSANAGNGGDVCDKTFALNAIISSGTGAWSFVDGPGTAVFTPDAIHPNAKVTVSQFGAYDFAWTVINNLCTSSDVIRVMFHDLPSVNAGQDTAVCEGSKIQLNATGTGSFLWSPANILNNSAISNPLVTPVVTTDFTVTQTDQWGCKNSDLVNVEVRSKPIADAGPNQVLEYIFETVMEASPLSTHQTGEWTVLSGAGSFSNVNDPLSTVHELSLGQNSFIWTVNNGVCPADADTVNITVNNLVIPTLITPNHDGKNDYFVINGIKTFGNTSLTIFDRWGARVYKNSNYDNEWDGVDDNNHPLPDDTYFFILKPEKGKPISGYVVIRR